MSWKMDHNTSVDDVRAESVKVRGQVNTLIQDFISKLPKGCVLEVNVISHAQSLGSKQRDVFIDFDITI